LVLRPTLTLPRNFAETGAASEIAILLKEYDLGIVGSNQLDLTPFQKQVLLAHEQKKAEEQQERIEGAKGGSGGHIPNSRASSSGPTIKETIRYKNENEADHDWEVVE